MMTRVIVETRCPYCGSPVRIEGSDYGVFRVQCSKCGAIVIAYINVNIKAERVDESMLREFREWLIREKKVMKDTAQRYARDVERWIKEGKWPRAVAPIDYWNEWKERRKT